MRISPDKSSGIKGMSPPRGEVRVTQATEKQEDRKGDCGEISTGGAAYLAVALAQFLVDLLFLGDLRRLGGR